MLFPNLLNKNDKILLISTARKVKLEELNYAFEIFNAWELVIECGKNLFETHHQFAGTDEQRAEDLQWALNHPTAKAIICVRGGYGTARIIDKIDFSTFMKLPKWVD